MKICGNRFAQDSFLVASHEPDFMGWIFSPASPRRITPEQARDLINAIRQRHPRIRHVGVFARNTVPDILRCSLVVGHLDYLQIVDGSGLIPGPILADAERIGLVPPIAPALRVRNQLRDSDLLRHGRPPFHVLDSFVAGRPGGTGKRLSPEFIKDIHRPYLLAGGLRPDNLREAVADIQPMGVDVSSGLEDNEPGRKNPNKLSEFVRLARDLSI